MGVESQGKWYDIGYDIGYNVGKKMPWKNTQRWERWWLGDGFMALFYPQYQDTAQWSQAINVN